MGITCPRCGFRNDSSAIHCVSCGQELKKASNKQFSLLNYIEQIFASTELHGKVINKHPTYFQKPDFNSKKLLLIFPLILFAILFYKLIIVLLIVLVILIVILSLLRIPIGGLMLHLILIRAFTGGRSSNKEVPVQDLVVQDTGGRDYLVRIKGHLAVGNVSIGDTVTVKGKLKGGMLLFRACHRITC